MNSEDNMDLGKIDAEMKKNIDARTKEFKEKLAKLTYEKIKSKLVPSKEPLKGYPHNESMVEAADPWQDDIDYLRKLDKTDPKKAAAFRKRTKALKKGGGWNLAGKPTPEQKKIMQQMDRDAKKKHPALYKKEDLEVAESLDLDEYAKENPMIMKLKGKKVELLKTGSSFKPTFTLTVDGKEEGKFGSENDAMKHFAKMTKEEVTISMDESVNEGTLKVSDWSGDDAGGDHPKKFGLRVKKVGSGSYGGDNVEISGSDAKLVKWAQNNLGVKGKNLSAVQKELDEGTKATKMLSVSDMSERVMTLKQIAQKHKGLINKAQRSGNAEDLKQAEKDLLAWAMKHNEVSGKDPDEEDDWLSNVVSDKKQFDALLKFAKD